MVVSGKTARPLTRVLHFVECLLSRDFIAFVSFSFSRSWSGYQCSFSRTILLFFVFPKTAFCLSDMVDSEGNGLEKSRNILHIRGRNCLLPTKSHTQFHYIYKLPNMFLLLPNHSEMRPRKSSELVTPSYQQSSNVSPAVFKNF